MEGDVLRDTGCSGVVVKQLFVTTSQFTGKFGFMQMADNTLRRVPIATVSIDTPYFTGSVEVLCPPDAIYNAIIGNIVGSLSSE